MMKGRGREIGRGRVQGRLNHFRAIHPSPVSGAPACPVFFLPKPVSRLKVDSKRRTPSMLWSDREREEMAHKKKKATCLQNTELEKRQKRLLATNAKKGTKQKTQISAQSASSFHTRISLDSLPISHRM